MNTKPFPRRVEVEITRAENVRFHCEFHGDDCLRAAVKYLRGWQREIPGAVAHLSMQRTDGRRSVHTISPDLRIT
jgi:hypothetical protein